MTLHIDELEDRICLDEKCYPRVSTRENLEGLGARYLKTDRFRIAGEEKTIEYMVMESDVLLIWKKMDGDQNYELHMLAPEIKKFTGTAVIAR